MIEMVILYHFQKGLFEQCDIKILEKSLSSNEPFLILCEYLLTKRKIKKLIKAKIDKKLASIDSVPI